MKNKKTKNSYTHPQFSAAHAYVALFNNVVEVGGHLWRGSDLLNVTVETIKILSPSFSVPFALKLLASLSSVVTPFHIYSTI